jgi:hypothetical protein
MRYKTHYVPTWESKRTICGRRTHYSLLRVVPRVTVSRVRVTCKACLKRMIIAESQEEDHAKNMG